MIEKYKYVNSLDDIFLSHGGMFKGTIKKQFKEFGNAWAEEFNETLNAYVTYVNSDLSEPVRAYVNFCLEAMRLQKQFDDIKDYPKISYSEACSTVYKNYQYMTKVYLPALYLTHFLWRHHYLLKKWIENKFFPLLKEKKTITFCDIGIGTGFYSNKLLSAFKESEGYGFDISDASIDHTKKVLASSGCLNRYNILDKMFTENNEVDFNCFVCIELLEHLEHPEQLIKEIYSQLAHGGVGVISAAVNAPNRDHIYLYRNNDEVRQQILNSGFLVKFEQKFDAYEKGIFTQSVPSSASFIVKKA